LARLAWTGKQGCSKASTGGAGQARLGIVKVRPGEAAAWQAWNGTASSGLFGSGLGGAGAAGIRPGAVRRDRAGYGKAGLSGLRQVSGVARQRWAGMACID